MKYTERLTDTNGHSVFVYRISNRRDYVIRHMGNKYRPWGVYLVIRGKKGSYMLGTKEDRWISLAETHYLKYAKLLVGDYFRIEKDKIY